MHNYIGYNKMKYNKIIIIIIIIIFLHGLCRLTSSGIDALSSFPGASTIFSSSRFVVEYVINYNKNNRRYSVHVWKNFCLLLFTCNWASYNFHDPWICLISLHSQRAGHLLQNAVV
jgi:hypothetical protein